MQRDHPYQRTGWLCDVKAAVHKVAGVLWHAAVYALVLTAGASLSVLPTVRPAAAQTQQAPAAAPAWPSDVEVQRQLRGATVPEVPASPAVPPAETGGWNATGKAAPGAAAAKATIQLAAFLTQDGEPIDQGVVWRIYKDVKLAPGEEPKPAEVLRTAKPVTKLEPGSYLINAAFGRAHLTRRVTVKDTAMRAERFVLNAGGLRVAGMIGEEAAPASSLTYDIYQGDADQLGGRSKVAGGIRPAIIVRLNAGLYHIVSTLGDANAVMSADVTVEAGKLTDATVHHHAARVALKLVAQPGGEAQADTQWVVRDARGQVVRESNGALPTHILAVGNYVASAQHGGRRFEQPFAVTSGVATQVEVVMR